MNTKKVFERKAQIIKEVSGLNERLKKEKRQLMTEKEQAHFDALELELKEVEKTLNAVEQENSAAPNYDLMNKTDKSYQMSIEASKKALFKGFQDLLANQAQTINQDYVRATYDAITSTTEAAVLKPVSVRNPFFEALGNNEFLSRVTKEMVNQGDVIPVMERANYGQNLTEGQATEETILAGTTLTFASKTVALKNKYVFSRWHNNVGRDSRPGAEKFIIDACTASMTDAICRDVINGDSSTAGQMDGILQTSGIQSVTASGGTLDYDHIIIAIEKLLAKNARPEDLTVLLSPSGWQHLASYQDTTNAFVSRPDALKDIRFITSSHVPEDLGAGSETVAIVANLSNCFLYMGGNYEVTLRERYIDADMSGLFLLSRNSFIIPDPEGTVCKISGIDSTVVVS